MKKAIMGLVLLFVLLLSSCDNEEVFLPPEIIECTENQIKFEDSCINLSGSEIQLRESIENSMDISNYVLEVKIITENLEYPITIFIDDDLSQMIYDYSQREQLFKNNSDGTCSVVETYLLTEQEYEIDCSNLEDYTFFKTFEYSWFEINAGKYRVKEEFISNIEESVNFGFESIEITNVDLSVIDNHLSEINIGFIVNETSYIVMMAISQIGQVELIWEEGVS